MIKLLQKEELSLTNILNCAKKIYKENFMTLLFITIIVFFPINILLTIVQNRFFHVYDAIDFNAILSDPILLEQFASSNERNQIMIYSGIFTAINLFFVPIGIMAVAKVANDYIYGGKASYKHAILESFSKGAYLIIAALIYIICVSIGVSFFLIPGLFLIVSWYFYIYAIALSDKKGISSLAHSMSLVKGKWFKTLFMVLFFYLTNYFISLGVQMIFSFGMNFFVLDVFSKTISFLVNIFYYISITIWFLNREFLINQKNSQY